MFWFGAVFAFLFGAILGSALNVLVYRLKAETEWYGRSRCVHCEHVLKPHHLVPIFSWVFLRGKCAFCSRPIHIQYPAVELLAGCLTLGHYLVYLFSTRPFDLFRFSLELLFLFCVFGLAVFDWRWKLLPLEVMGVFGVLFGLLQISSGHLPWTSVVHGVIFGLVFLGLPFVVSRGRWMGGGDPILAAMMGAMLGWPGIGISLYFTYMIAGVVLFGLWISGRLIHVKRVAFAPLLALGATCAVWFGPALEAWIRAVFL